MTKTDFYKAIFEKVALACENKDKFNVLDLRVYKFPYRDDCDIYCLNEVDELYDDIKDCKEWFIDIYENITDANMAVYTDYALFSDEVVNSTPQAKNIKITIEIE